MLSWEYPPRIVGGIARHVEELSEALVSKGHEVHVITADHPNTPQYELRKGVHIHRVPADNTPTPDFVTWIHHLNWGMAELALRLHQAHPFDMVHAHDWLVAQSAVLLKKSFGVPLVGTIHATESGRNQGIHTSLQSYIHHQEWFLTYESYRVIVCSQYMYREVRELFAVPEDKLDIRPNGIDFHKFDFPFEQRQDFRRQFAMDHEKVVMFVGRMVPEKGAQVLIEAVPQILAHYPDAKFVVVGKGGFLPDLKRRAAALRLGSKILFTGYVDDDTLLRIYRTADVAVAPSLYEPFGIVALEGMAAKVPTVVADTGGLGEIIDHTRTGVTTYAGDPDSLAWGILQVLRHPREAGQMAENAYQKVLDVFNWQVIADQTLSTYDRVLEMSGRKEAAAR
jgi:glycosyltransferase involved in cell wall biosynthesis